MTSEAPFHTFGNHDLLTLHKVAFLCSRKCPAAVVLKSFDWAIEQREKGTQPVILALARGMMKKWTTEFKAALDGMHL